MGIYINEQLSSVHTNTEGAQDFGHRELAALLTAIELEEGLLTVRPREFVCKRWMDGSLKSVHPDLGGCAHLTRLIESTNQRIAVGKRGGRVYVCVCMCVSVCICCVPCVVTCMMSIVVCGRNYSSRHC